MIIKIHYNNMSSIKNEKLRQATLNTHALLYRQALEQKIFPNKPVACAYFNDGLYHVNLMGERSELLQLLFGTITAILKDLPPNVALSYYEYLLNAVSQVNAEKCCETLFGNTEAEAINVKFADELIDYLDKNFQVKEEQDGKNTVSNTD